MIIEFYSYLNNEIHPDNYVSLMIDSSLLKSFYVSSSSYLDLVLSNDDSFNFPVICLRLDSALRVFISDVSDFNKLCACFHSYTELPCWWNY